MTSGFSEGGNKKPQEKQNLLKIKGERKNEDDESNGYILHGKNKGKKMVVC